MRAFGRNYKEGMNCNNSFANQSAGQPDGLARVARMEVAEVFDMSAVSQSRKLFYFYSVLLLLVLLFHTIQNFHDPARTGAEVDPEVARFIELGTLAKDLY